MNGSEFAIAWAVMKWPLVACLILPPLLAYMGVLAIALALCALITWGLARLARDGDVGISDAPPTAAETDRAWIQRPTGTGAPTTV